VLWDESRRRLISFGEMGRPCRRDGLPVRTRADRTQFPAT
jgi:hypothetical protein